MVWKLRPRGETWSRTQSNRVLISSDSLVLTSLTGNLLSQTQFLSCKMKHLLWLWVLWYNKYELTGELFPKYTAWLTQKL